MLVLLPPSRSKAPDTRSRVRFDPAALSFPELAGARAAQLAGVSLGAGGMPALDRYTGVLYAALHARLDAAGASRRAYRRALVFSRLFGMVTGSDLLPYTDASEDPEPGQAPGRLWRPLLTPLLADLAAGTVLVDLRSATVAGLASLPPGRTLRVEPRYAPPSGPERAAPSHTGKHLRGLLAGRLLTGPGAGSVRTPRAAADAVRAALADVAVEVRPADPDAPAGLVVVTRTTVAADLG